MRYAIAAAVTVMAAIIIIEKTAGQSAQADVSGLSTLGAEDPLSNAG